MERGGSGFRTLQTWPCGQETPSEAREALAVAGASLVLPTKRGDPWERGAAGRIYALVGDAGRAIPLLRGEEAWCGEVPDTMAPVSIDTQVVRMRCHLLLGQMLEQNSDRVGACAEYAAVLSRWGNAKPRSVTAEKARARSKALACAQ